MPYLNIQTNVSMDADKQQILLKKASQTVASMLGKPESYVMVNLDSGHTMLFAGSDVPLAYLQLKSLSLAEDQTSDFSQILCELMQSELSIEAGRVYIEFSSPERHLWGWNGGTF